jgi:hypothetical protein
MRNWSLREARRPFVWGQNIRVSTLASFSVWVKPRSSGDLNNAWPNIIADTKISKASAPRIVDAHNLTFRQITHLSIAWVHHHRFMATRAI